MPNGPDLVSAQSKTRLATRIKGISSMHLHWMVLSLAYIKLPCTNCECRFFNHWGPFYQHGLIIFPAWISNGMPCKGWDDVSDPFPSFKGCTVEVWKWIRNCIPHFIMSRDTYPCWNLSESMLAKGDPAVRSWSCFFAVAFQIHLWIPCCHDNICNGKNRKLGLDVRILQLKLSLHGHDIMT